MKPGTLYLVGTPIGNLSDFSPRAAEVLREVDAILAEDTRQAGILCQAFAIETPKIAFHRHNAERRIPEIVERLGRGDALALVTDRGMPAVSDPGAELVDRLWREDIPFAVVPGPTALTTAFAGSGYPHPFVFWGFLPTAAKARRVTLAEMAAVRHTQILYEAPHRLEKTLDRLARTLGGDREITIGRELTKQFEEFWRGTLAEAKGLEHLAKGELVLVLAPVGQASLPPPDPGEWEELVDRVVERTSAGWHEKEAIADLASQFGVNKRELYRLVQRRKKPPSL